MKRTTTFFWNIHRAVFDPVFFREVRAQPSSRAWRFFAGVVLLSSLCMGIAHTYYFVKPGSGFGAQIVAAFEGIKITGGTLMPPRPAPYLISPRKLSRALELAGGMPSMVDFLPDSFLAVDTGGAIVTGPTTTVHALLTKTRLVLNPGTVVSYAVSYPELIGRGDFTVDAGSVQRLLKRNSIPILASFIIKDMLFQVLNCLSALLFLFLAAFILKIEGARQLAESLAFALYATVPFVAGTAIEAAAGTQIKGTWFFFMMVSLVVLFRGVRSCLVESRERKIDR